MIQRVPTRIIKEASHRGWFNMAADDYFSTSIHNSEYKAILRFYFWDPPAVSLGKNQDDSTISLNNCSDAKWDVVKRSTGGRALLHLEDLSYSLIMRLEDKSLSRLRQIYEGLAEALISVLQFYNVSSSYCGTSREMNSNLFNTKLCLNSRVRGEVQVREKKINAVSQRVYKDSVLQHGSIFFSSDSDQIVSVTKFDGFSINDLSNELRKNATTMLHETGENIDRSDFALRFSEKISNVFSLHLIERAISIGEEESISQLKDEFSILENQFEPAQIH